MVIQGIVTPLATPLISRDDLDYDGLERLIAGQLLAKVSGIFILGTTGEGPGLSQQTRRDLIEATAKLLPADFPWYVCITDTSLTDAIDLAEFAAESGATAAVAAPPFYFPAGQTELQHWFTKLASQISLPLILYNMPSCTKISIEPTSLERLVEHPNIVGLKDSSGDLQYFQTAIQIAASSKREWPVLIGPEALLVDAMAMGSAGGVTGGANLAPRLYVDLYTAITGSDSARIAKLQEIVRELQNLYRFGKYDSSYLKGLKCSLELVGVCSGLLVAPYDIFQKPERTKVAAWLKKFARHGYLDFVDADVSEIKL